MGRNYLAGSNGDAANAVLAAAGYNFRRLLEWLAAFWRAFVMAILAAARDDPIPSQDCPRGSSKRTAAPNPAVFTGDEARLRVDLGRPEPRTRAGAAGSASMLAEGTGGAMAIPPKSARTPPTSESGRK